ncbi:YegS/Rv2252/BmrU family lipid kinase [Mucilaginibacter yixingensis]|uniref:YegS/Rv2252/BmrU family lipid kinase n=1 Tax=Mucilaginibacter yixingensis TaxID=1295612 RepID=A0A2T5JBY3_9SPHI|nr:diacylglycerol kinase family protein [Mucilaginibacter yixingensis]PTQ99266.1 YegS/Rv2252/BmrU family lipid kinase [Mucilaginibacter yixingensis]
MKRKVLFIINPISGGKKKDSVPGLIKQYLDADRYEYAIGYTASAGHATTLAAEAVGVHDIVVAVGGDGTINEVASGIAGSDTLFGIIPFGSGNGLSRFLNIPLDVVLAIKSINNCRVERIDAGKLNGKYFFNMAGMGFDAHISEVFSHHKERGFMSYVRSAFSEVMSFKPDTYTINIDGKEVERQAFMLSIANSSQYGNNAHISPMASVQDGLLDVCVVKPFPVWKFLWMASIMFTKTADKSSAVEIHRGKHIRISRTSEGPIHLDGEPQIAGAELQIDIIPAVLNIIVGSAYKN